MHYQHILYDVTDGVATITLNRPEKLNSFNVGMHEDLKDALAQVRDDDAVRALLLTGAGRAFCAGQDLADRMVAPGEQGPDLGASVETHYIPLVLALRTLPIPAVCAVNGVAAGAGANLALACDIVLAGHSASFIEPFCRLGLVPDTGGTWMLPRLIGPARAAGLAMLGEKLPAHTAEQWGLIWKCCADEVLLDEAHALARQLAHAPTKGLACTKQALQASLVNTLQDQLHLEARMMRVLGNTHDYREGVAAFMEKHTPHFTGN